MFDWFRDNPALTSTLVGGSVLMFIVGLLAMPFIVCKIPADYFAHDDRPPSRLNGHRKAIRITLLIGKNLLGVVLLLAGIAMLVLPGQGILTMVVGFLLLDLPGKYRMEKRLIAQRWIHRPINWLRQRRGQPPLLLRHPTPSV